jgi:hypothetical protein
MDNKQRKQLIHNCLGKLRKYSRILNRLNRNCPHEFEPLTTEELADQWMSVGAYCLICDKSFGWRCKESPDGVCHYKNEVDDKQLLFCVHSTHC